MIFRLLKILLSLPPYPHKKPGYDIAKGKEEVAGKQQL
jgi:hypothetical protein